MHVPSSGHGADPHRKHLLQHLFYSCVRLLWALPSNGSTLLSVAYLLRACLPSCSLAMGLHVTIHYPNLILYKFNVSQTTKLKTFTQIGTRVHVQVSFSFCVDTLYICTPGVAAVNANCFRWNSIIPVRK
jgi:hypothetical protein